MLEKLRKLSLGIVLLVMASTFIYGIARFSDNPISPCRGPGGYCGKQGQPETAERYHAFVIWQTAIWYVWPLGFIAIMILNRKSILKDWDRKR